MSPPTTHPSSQASEIGFRAKPGWLFLWVSVPLLVLYIVTGAPTVTGEDSGELIAAAYTLDIAHPPGYPLWILLTHGFQRVFRGLGPASAAHLGSAVATAAAMGLLAVIAWRILGSVTAAIVAAFWIGVGRETWNHATIAEVYALNLLLLAASVLLTLRWKDAPGWRRMGALATTYGFGLTHHPTFLFFLPAFALGALVFHPRVLRDWRSILVAVVGLTAPFLVYVQVWIAAAGKPFVSWGVKPELRSVVGHFLREAYQHGPEKTPRTWEKFWGHTQSFFQYQFDELTLFGWIVASVGLALLLVRQGWVGRWCAAMALWGTFGLLPFLDADLEREGMFANRVFLLPAYLFGGLGIAASVTALLRRFPLARQPRVLVALGGLPVLLAAIRFPDADRSGYHWAADYGRAILASVPDGGALLPGGDTSTFPLIYLQVCAHHRTDVTILDRSGTLERSESLALLPESLRAAFADAPSDVLRVAVLRHSTKPVVTLRRSGLGDHAERTLVPHGLGFLAVSTRSQPSDAQIADGQQRFLERQLRLRNEEISTVRDHTADVIQSHVWQVRAVASFAAGDPAAGIAGLERALRHGQGQKETLNNVGAAYADHGHPDRALDCFRSALELRPDYHLARRNLVTVLASRGDPETALLETRRGLAWDAQDRDLLRVGVELARALEDRAAVNALCAHWIATYPEDPEPQRVLCSLSDVEPRERPGATDGEFGEGPVLATQSEAEDSPMAKRRRWLGDRAELGLPGGVPTPPKGGAVAPRQPAFGTVLDLLEPSRLDRSRAASHPSPARFPHPVDSSVSGATLSPGTAAMTPERGR